jgi:copper chaperone CopZ
MVWILERIDGKTEDQSILETKIEERLLKSGFDLVARTAIEDNKKKEMADAAASNNVAKAQAIAKDLDAEIFIIGTANANQAGLVDLYGTSAAAYNCDAQIKVYYTDSAKLLASKGLPNTRGGARGRKEFSPQAGKMALDFAGQNIVEELYAQIMEQWATQISAGGELILEVSGVNFKVANDLKKAIAGIEGVNSVNMKLTKSVATYSINAKMSAQDLAEKLSAGPTEKMVEIQDLKLNRIQGKAKGG